MQPTTAIGLAHRLRATPWVFPLLAWAGCQATGTGAGDAMAGPGDAGDLSPACAAAVAPDPSAAGCGGDEGPPRGLATDATGFSVHCGATEVRVDGVQDGVVRLAYGAIGDAGVRPSTRSYAVLPSPAPLVRFGHGCDAALLCTAELAVRVRTTDCRVSVVDRAGTTIVDEPDGGGFSVTAAGPRLARLAPAGDRYIGAGEHTGPLALRGRTVSLWNTDAYVASFGGWPADAAHLYQSIPFFVGLRDGRAFGVFTDETRRLALDFAATDPAAWTVATEAPGSLGPSVSQFVIAGPLPGDVLDRYTRLTGRPSLPPRWALGYHQSRWGYYPDSRFRQIAAEFRNRQIPADGLFVDIQHMDGFRDFTWDPAGFPNPAGLVGDLGALGFKTTVIVDPGLKVDPSWELYQAGVTGRFFVGDGRAPYAPYAGEAWPGATVWPDFTKGDVRAWWGGLMRRETDLGVRGIWLDMNEPSNFKTGDDGTLPAALPVDGDGAPATMADAHNVYALEEARATWEGLAAAVPDRRPFILTRAGFAGIQRYAAVWTGDAPSTWDTLGATLPMLLGLGVSGVPLVGSDVGGYSGGATAELFARWMELGALSPFFRGHVQNGAPDQEPWAFGTEVTDISREVISLRYQLLPYLYSLVRTASQTGAPPLRPLGWEFPADEKSLATDDEAMLGPALLAAPIVTQGATQRSIYLPPGRWVEVRSGAIFDGPATMSQVVTLAALPLFAREGAIVPRGPAMAYSDEKPLAPLFIDAYPARGVGTRSTFDLYEDDGSSRQFEQGAYALTALELETTQAGAQLSATRTGTFTPPARTVVVTIRRVDHSPISVTLAGQALPSSSLADLRNGLATGWAWDPDDLSVVASFSDGPTWRLALAYDAGVPDPRPLVAMPFVVTVPAGTPTDKPICIASSASNWTHQPLAWDASGRTASGTILVPRGQWLFYKYTRGDWSTVEKWPGCVEATNRYELGAAHPVKQDTVWAWADRCP